MVGKVGVCRGATSLVAVAATLLIISQTCLASEVQVKEEGGAMELKSSAFLNNQDIPKKYTCDGADVSPQLFWDNPPDEAKAFALISDDPDAPVGTWVHWVIYDLPGEAKELAEGVPKQENLPNGAKQGVNDFKKVGYGGPCPPRGPAHRYFFKLYALDRPTNLKPRATKQQILAAMKGHILGEAQLVGTYKR
jgi:Raf kinase inhibitor-like YbhB/YbcL family protein